MQKITLEELVAFLKEQGFVFQGSEIYGGLANAWDYGPLGVELKNNIKQAWWNKFVKQNRYNVGLDAAILMNKEIFTFENITNLVTPIAKKYGVKKIYLFGSYARGEATENSDLDFLVFGGDNFKLTLIFALAEDLRKALQKDVDVFEINEINKDSNFYHTIMKERLLVA